MMKKSLLVILLLVAICAGGFGPIGEGATFQKEQGQMPEYEGKVNAPDFPEGMQWLNTEKPISLRDLRGKVVLLDFWTYCCINCMHVIPDLKKLEKKYANELVVIGVHSAKFNGERDIDPVINKKLCVVALAERRDSAGKVKKTFAVEIFFPQLNSLDAAVQGLLEHPEELASLSCRSIGD